MQPTNKPTQLQGLGIALLRVVAGFVFLSSGVHKLFVEDLTQQGISLVLLVFVAIALGELLCGAALVVGLLTRWVSIPLALLMLADILVLHPPYEFFEQDHGYESALLRLTASIALALTGSGKVALDNVLALQKDRSKR